MGIVSVGSHDNSPKNPERASKKPQENKAVAVILRALELLT